jgi:hypothetical protein
MTGSGDATRTRERMHMSSLLAPLIATAHSLGSDIGCLRFVSPNAIAICDRSAIALLSLDLLIFESLNYTTGKKSP